MPPDRPTSKKMDPSEANRPDMTQAIDPTRIHHEAQFHGIPRTTLLMVLMFVVGMGWALFEVKKTRDYAPPESDQAQEALVDVGIPLVFVNIEGRAKSKQEIQSILSEFEKTKSSVSPARPSNPFLLPDSLRVTEQKEPDEPEEGMDEPEQPEEVPVAPVKVEAPPWKHLQVKSILIGPPSWAWISGNLVRVGQSIGGWKVEKILPDRVIIQWKDERHEIYLGS